MKNIFYYGGQAVIEGVMMRGKENIAVSVYRPDGTLSIWRQKIPGIYKGRIRNVPFFRGIFVLIESMVLGIKSLFYSAEVASFGDEEKIPPIAIAGVVILSLAFAVGLFFISPLLIARVLDAYITSDLLSNVIEGIIRIMIFVLYLVAIRQFPDVKRIYRYHGAEHKVINAYEDGRELIVEEMKPYPTAHTRCGTSFIFVVMTITILVFAIVGRPSILVSILSRIALLPVIAAIGYEITRLGARYCKNPLAKILLAPGLLLQSLTTMEPDDNQIKAAISSLKEVIMADSNQVVSDGD